MVVSVDLSVLEIAWRKIVMLLLLPIGLALALLDGVDSKTCSIALPLSSLFT